MRFCLYILLFQVLKSYIIQLDLLFVNLNGLTIQMLGTTVYNTDVFGNRVSDIRIPTVFTMFDVFPPNLQG